MNSGCEDAQVEYGFDGFIIAHFPRDSDGEIERERERVREIERKISKRLKGTVQGVLFSESWLLNSAAKIWLDMIGWFLSSIHFTTNEQHQQHHATTQNTSKQLAQCSFDHICSCMDPVLFSSMLTETRTVDDVGQVFPEVGWYGKTCLDSLLNLVVESAVRI